MADSTSNTNNGFSTGGDHPGFSNTPHFEGYEIRGESVSSQSSSAASANPFASIAGSLGNINVEGLSEAVSGYATAYDKSLRANPYLHIGLAGAGALFLGYLLGRSTAPAAAPAARMGAYDEGIDE